MKANGMKLNVVVVGGHNPDASITTGELQECMAVGHALGACRANVLVPIDEKKHGLAHMVANLATTRSSIIPRLVDPDLAGSGMYETFYDGRPGIIQRAYIRPSYVKDEGYIARIVAKESIRAFVILGHGGPAELLALVQAMAKNIVIIACGGGLAGNATSIEEMMASALGLNDPEKAESRNRVLYKFSGPLTAREVHGAIRKARKMAAKELADFERQLNLELLQSCA